MDAKVKLLLAEDEEYLEGNPHLTVIRHPTTGKLYIRQAPDSILDVGFPPRTIADLESMITHLDKEEGE
jgi:hypothetical protein